MPVDKIDRLNTFRLYLVYLRLDTKFRRDDFKYQEWTATQVATRSVGRRAQCERVVQYGSSYLGSIGGISRRQGTCPTPERIGRTSISETRDAATKISESQQVRYRTNPAQDGNHPCFKTFGTSGGR